MTQQQNLPPKKVSPSFITEIPLKITLAQETTLNKRFEAARQVYNACLGESLKRLQLMRESRAWQKARNIPRDKTRTDTFRALNEQFGFRKYDIQSYAKQETRPLRRGFHGHL